MNVMTLTAPSGHTYTIREQNGQDEEILTNSADVKNIMNITKFLQAIIVETSRKPEGKGLTVDEVLRLPVLDRYAIMFEARIFSLGKDMDFVYRWEMPDGTTEDIEFEQDLTEFLLPYEGILNSDYSEEAIENILQEKPNAIPVYPMRGQERDIIITLETGKKIKFDLLDGHAERYAVKLADNQSTRNAELIARNLHLEVEGNFERVQNFSLFTRKEMAEMRKAVRSIDPVFTGTTELVHPRTNEVVNYPIIANPAFFFPEDME